MNDITRCAEVIQERCRGQNPKGRATLRAVPQARVEEVVIRHAVRGEEPQP